MAVWYSGRRGGNVVGLWLRNSASFLINFTPFCPNLPDLLWDHCHFFLSTIISHKRWRISPKINPKQLTLICWMIFSCPDWCSYSLYCCNGAYLKHNYSYPNTLLKNCVHDPCFGTPLVELVSSALFSCTHVTSQHHAHLSGAKILCF